LLLASSPEKVVTLGFLLDGAIFILHFGKTNILNYAFALIIGINMINVQLDAYKSNIDKTISQKLA
jgi:hypothetical protein